MLMCFIFAFSPLNNIVRVYMYELDLDLDLYPTLNWTHWAILRRHPCLSRAATSASSQVNPICMANNSAAVRSAYIERVRSLHQQNNCESWNSDFAQSVGHHPSFHRTSAQLTVATDWRLAWGRWSTSSMRATPQRICVARRDDQKTIGQTFDAHCCHMGGRIVVL